MSGGIQLVKNGHLAALLHRCCFDSVLRRCSCVWDMLLIDVVSTPGVVHPILQFTGASSLCHFAACAAALRDGAENHKWLAMLARVHGNQLAKILNAVTVIPRNGRWH